MTGSSAFVRGACIAAVAARLAGGAPALLAQAAAPSPDPAQIEKVVLADGVFLYRMPIDAFGQGKGNSTVIVNEHDVTIFDSSMRPSSAQALIGEIRKLTDKPVRIVVNSHWHQDHWTGNAIYAREFPGVQLIATTRTRDFMRGMAPTFAARGFGENLARRVAALDTAIRTGRRPDGSAFTAADRRDTEADVAAYRRFATEMDGARHLLPTIGYRDSLIIWSGAREIRLISVDGDAEASTVLYLPREKVLLVGDLLVHPIQWGTNSFRIRPWLASLEALGALDVQVVVPGHGPAFRDRSYLLLVTELFRSIVTQVDAALDRGVTTVEAVQGAVDLDALRTRFAHGDPVLERRFRQYSAEIVSKAFQEARDGFLR